MDQYYGDVQCTQNAGKHLIPPAFRAESADAAAKATSEAVFGHSTAVVEVSWREPVQAGSIRTAKACVT